MMFRCSLCSSSVIAENIHTYLTENSKIDEFATAIGVECGWRLWFLFKKIETCFLD